MQREDEQFEQFEALFDRRAPKGPIGSKYEGKSPFKCFACNKIGHFASKCLERNSRFEVRARRYIKPNPRYQNKHKYKKNRDKSCYIVDEEGVTDSNDEPTQDYASGSWNGREFVLLAIKEDDLALEENILEEHALATKIEDKDEWVIDSGCSHHTARDKRKFLSLQEFDGGLVRFEDDKACMIKGKGTISLYGKHNTDNVYYVEGLRNNLLSVGQLVYKGFKLQFKDGK